MSRTYMVRIMGELKSSGTYNQDIIWALLHKYVPKSQIWKVWFGYETDFDVIIEVGAGGGDHISDKLANHFKPKLDECETIVDYELWVYDLHPDKIICEMKKGEKENDDEDN